jgi:hypothetical protein
MQFDVAIPTDDGRWVSEAHARIAEIIQDYDDTLELAWIPPDKRVDPRDPPFAVICRPRNNKPPYIVFKSDTCDESLLARLFASDNKDGNVLRNIEAQEAAREAVRLKKLMDEEEFRKDFVASIAKSHLNSYKHNGIDFHKRNGR